MPEMKGFIVATVVYKLKFLFIQYLEYEGIYLLRTREYSALMHTDCVQNFLQHVMP